MNELARRWRLILGRYAEQSLPGSQLGSDGELELALSFLYDREYEERGLKLDKGQGGGRGASQITSIAWLERSRKLFPRSTFERLQAQAIERYGLTDILADPKAVAGLEPSPELASALLRVRGRLDAKLEAGMRVVIAKVVEQIVAKLKLSFTNAVMGRRDRQRRSMQPRAANFDWRRTVRANLTHYDVQNRRLLIDQARFSSRQRRRLPWDVILCVDQSGSMAASVLHSAICASILAGLPGVNVRLLLFDTAIADMTHMAHDPVSVLMTVQMGGGTDIAGAMGYAERLVRTPRRTVIAVVSDFEEGGSVQALLATVTRLREAGVTLLGLAALDESAEASYDANIASRLADRGMNVAALTPDHFAQWLGAVMA